MREQILQKNALMRWVTRLNASILLALTFTASLVLVG